MFICNEIDDSSKKSFLFYVYVTTYLRVRNYLFV